jgi:hypothetical protein
MWRPQAEALRAAGHRVLAPDLRDEVNALLLAFLIDG